MCLDFLDCETELIIDSQQISIQKQQINADRNSVEEEKKPKIAKPEIPDNTINARINFDLDSHRIDTHFTRSSKAERV